MEMQIIVRVVEELQYQHRVTPTCTKRSLHIWRSIPGAVSKSGFMGSIDLLAHPLPSELATSLPVWGIHCMNGLFQSKGPNPTIASPALLTWLAQEHPEWPYMQFRLDDPFGVRVSLDPRKLFANA